MDNKNRYCIICGSSLQVHNLCSDDCVRKYNEYKKNSNLISIKGFCNFCGKPHELTKNYRNIVPNRHKDCYSSGLNLNLTLEEYLQKKEEKKHLEIGGKKLLEDRIKIELSEKQQKSRQLLFNKKLFDGETHYLICPRCSYYSVKYLNNMKKWFCLICDSEIIINSSFNKYDINFTDEDKYKIYRYWGIDALSQLTNESIEQIQSFAASFFKKCCLSRGDNCLYSDFLKEIEISEQIKLIEYSTENGQLKRKINRRK